MNKKGSKLPVIDDVDVITKEAKSELSDNCGGEEDE